MLLYGTSYSHIADECGNGAGKRDSVHLQPWPSYDSAQAIASTLELAVQLNGKIKARITVASDADDEEVRREALSAVSEAIGERNVRKVIVVQGKLVSVVV